MSRDHHRALRMPSFSVATLLAVVMVGACVMLSGWFAWPVIPGVLVNVTRATHPTLPEDFGVGAKAFVGSRDMGSTFPSCSFSHCNQLALEQLFDWLQTRPRCQDVTLHSTGDVPAGGLKSVILAAAYATGGTVFLDVGRYRPLRVTYSDFPDRDGLDACAR